MMNSKQIIRLGARIVILFVLICLAHILAVWAGNEKFMVREDMMFLSSASGAFAVLAAQYIDKKYP